MTPDIPPKLIILEPQSGPAVPVISYCSIGRAKTNSIVVACSEVSRRHAIIRREGPDGCILMDLGSSNGTFVNGQRVSHSHPLVDGDSIQIGSERFILRFSSPEPQGDSESSSAASRAASFVPCWLLMGDTVHAFLDAPDTASEDDSFKTMVGWLQMCSRIVERNHGFISDPFAGKLLAHWPDPDRSPAIAARVAETIRQIHPIQTRARMEFRLALHFGSVVIGEERSHGAKTIVGTELDFARAMESLAWKLSAPCLISEDAHRRISNLLPAAALEPCSLQGSSGSHRFFTVAAAG